MTSGAQRRRKRARGVLRAHLDAQWRRGQGNPRERSRVNRPPGNDSGAPQGYSDPVPRATISEVWPRG